MMCKSLLLECCSEGRYFRVCGIAHIGNGPITYRERGQANVGCVTEKMSGDR